MTAEQPPTDEPDLTWDHAAAEAASSTPRLLRRTHGPVEQRDAAACTSTDCRWASLLGGEDLHRSAKDHATRYGHRVEVQERRTLTTTYAPEGDHG